MCVVVVSVNASQVATFDYAVGDQRNILCEAWSTDATTEGCHACTKLRGFNDADFGTEDSRKYWCWPDKCKETNTAVASPGCENVTTEKTNTVWK